MIDKRKTKETYDKEVRIYDSSRATFEKGRFAARERGLLRQNIRQNIPDEGRILVVACGTGRHHAFLHNEFGCECIGVDLSTEMLKVARLKERRTELVCADAENLPFRNEVFDAVICSRALYLFGSKLTFLKEAYSSLKGRGKLMVSTISRGPLIIRLCIIVGLLEPDPAKFPYDSKDLKCMLSSVGLDGIQTRCVVFFADGPNGIAPARANGILSFLPKSALNLVRFIEEHLSDGRWVMGIGQKPCK